MDPESFSGLSDDPSDYSCGFMYELNTGTDNGGVNQYFHTGSTPTAGDISINSKMLQSYLRNLDFGKKPYILII